MEGFSTSPGAAEATGWTNSISALSGIPVAILKAELERRNEIRDSDMDDDSSSCGSRDRGDYNLPLHIFALFLILVLSTLACSFPIMARLFPRLPIPRHFLFLSRHFGTGVLIATAFVHLLPTAFVSLTDSCLPRFWNTTFPAMAGFLAMLSVFVVITVEMFFAMKGGGHIHTTDYDNLMGGGGHVPGGDPRNSRTDYIRLEMHDTSGSIDLNTVGKSVQRDSDEIDSPSHRVSIDDFQPSANHVKPGNGHNGLGLTTSDSYMDGDSYFPNENEAEIPLRPNNDRYLQANEGFESGRSVLPLQNPQRQLLQCLLLEAGILFHSIFIGMALSVTTGTPFIVLLVAISFHQTFEGFALGARIASLIPDLFAPDSPRPWLMALAYGTTTPIGQAIGLVLHNLYDPASTTGLLMVGITNAISSGLLLFAGLVELLAEDFLSESSYETLQGRRRIEACISVASGALLMAFVGAFA